VSAPLLKLIYNVVQRRDCWHSMLTPVKQTRQLQSTGSNLLVLIAKTNAGTRPFFLPL